jgi:tetratricopeptide (TPR) repeat protein
MQKIAGHAVKFAALFLLTLLATSGVHAQGSALDRARAAAANKSFIEAAQLYEEALKADPKDKAILIEAGDVNMSLERYSVAQNLYARAFDQSNRDAEVNRKLGLAFSRLGDHPRAIEAIQRALKYDDKSLDGYLALGEAYIAADSLSQAELTLTAARGKYPNALEPVIALGDLFFARKIYEGAIKQYEQALAKDPSLLEARVRLARSYRGLGRMPGTPIEEMNTLYTKALTEFSKVTTADPKNSRAWFEQGEIYLLANLYKEAGQAFKAYSGLRPDDPRGDIMFARAAYGGRFYLDAIEPLERVMQQNDSLSILFRDQARSMLALSYYADKNYAKSAQLYAMIPDSAMDSLSYTLYGQSTLLSGGDTARGVATFKKLIGLYPQDCNLSMGYGTMFYRMKRYQDAVDVFSKRLIDCPNEPTAIPNLYVGVSQYTLKRYDQAIDALTKAAAADSSNLQAHYWLMNAYGAKSQNAKAVEVARVITRIGTEKDAPQVAQAWAIIGKSRYDAKDYKGAIDAFNSSLRLNPESVSANMFTAISYHYLKDKENACKYYRLVLKYNPGNADAIKNMKTLGCN